MMSETKKGALPDSSLPTETREIEGVTYRVTRFGWWELLENLARAEQLLGPALVDGLRGELVASDLERVLDAQADLVAAAAVGLVRRITDENAERLMEKLGAQTVVLVKDRKVRLTRERMDAWFGQHPGHALLWLAFCLEVQFYSFFATPGSRALKWARTKGFLRTRADHDESESIESRGDPE